MPYTPSRAGSTTPLLSYTTLAPTAAVSIGGAGGVGGAGGGTGGDGGRGRFPSPSVSPVTVSALSQYSSTSTAGLLEELQICGLDSPSVSPTPSSSTLSHLSAYMTSTTSSAAASVATDDTLTATAACTVVPAVANVIMTPAVTHVTTTTNPLTACPKSPPLPSCFVVRTRHPLPLPHSLPKKWCHHWLFTLN